MDPYDKRINLSSHKDFADLHSRIDDTMIHYHEVGRKKSIPKSLPIRGSPFLDHES